jgi:tetratricopeptide (TPR) repeat protein
VPLHSIQQAIEQTDAIWKGDCYCDYGWHLTLMGAIPQVQFGEVAEATMDGLIAAYTAELRYSEAASAAGEFARRWPSAAASERSAWLSFRAGDYDRSIVAYRRATEQDPRSIKAWNGLGVCALNSWLLSDRLDGIAREEARHAFERSLEAEPAQPQVQKLLRTYAP